jgi:hypothetical protein
VLQNLEMAIAAALGGLGVAMADLHLVRDELASGALAAPFGLVVGEGTGYFLVAERGRLGEPKLAAFRDWLLAEAAADAARSRPPRSLRHLRRRDPGPAAPSGSGGSSRTIRGSLTGRGAQGGV